MLHAGDEVRAQPVDGPDELHVGDAGEQFLEEHLQLQSGELGAEAQVRAVAAERDVVVRRAPDVEAVGLGELGVVVVRRHEPHHHFVARADPTPAQFCVDGGRAAEVHRHRGPAQYLLDRRID